MPLFSYHVSHEQFAPRDLLRLVRRAEEAGFDAAFSSDHFHPWAPAQGHSGYAWSWLGAALQATSLPMGVISVPGWRYHPAVLAQKIATLGQMFPGRLWVALGSGENINEHIIGGEWPDKPERNAKLREGVEVIRALLRGEEVTHRGRVTVVEAKLYDLPEQPVPLFGPCVSEGTAEFLGGWADGLLTTGTTVEQAKRVVDAFCRGGGVGKPLRLKLDVCWGPTVRAALEDAHAQWRFNSLGGDVNWDLRTPAEFEQAARFIRPEDMAQGVRVTDSPDQLAEWVGEYVAIGFDSIDLHHVGADQDAFIDMAATRLLPALKG